MKNVQSTRIYNYNNLKLHLFKDERGAQYVFEQLFS